MRLKTLNGAPLPHHLDFSEASLLQVDDCDQIKPALDFIPLNSPEILLKWRIVGVKDAKIRTGWSQPHLPGSGHKGATDGASNFPFRLIRSKEDLQDSIGLDGNSFRSDVSVTDDYLQHSLIFHDTLLSSQVVQDTDGSVSSESFLTTSFGSLVSNPRVVDSPNVGNVVLQVSARATVTTLESLPTVQQLRSMYPQTPTPNLLCVLISNPETRQVQIRRSGRKMLLCELNIADHTQSGFRVTIWLHSQESNNRKAAARDDLSGVVKDIKIGDIVLLRNIALTSFRDTVHGQSLNPAIARTRTSIDVLMNHQGVPLWQMNELPSNIKDAFAKVKKWARMHVATHDENIKKRKRRTSASPGPSKQNWSHNAHDNSLPPDTLDAV